MKIKKSFFSLISILILFSSCTTYQYASLSSDLPQPTPRGFSYENDTIQMIFSFSGDGCPLFLNIYNKLNTPLIIDWNKSAIIINGNSFTINPNTSQINSNYSESTYKFDNNIEFTDGTMVSTITHKNRSGFIPPKSNLSLNEIAINKSFLSTDNATSVSKVNMQDVNYQPYHVKQYRFSRENSPLHFRCFISYSDQDRTNWNTVDNDFWVSSIYKTTGVKLIDSPNQFFVSKASGFGTAVGIVAITGLVVVSAKYYETDEAQDTF